MKVWRYALFGIAMAASAQERQGVNFYSLDKEIALGKSLAREADRKTTPLGNAVATAYVNRVVQALGAQLPNSRFSYVATIVKDDLGAEPLAIPGGYLYLPSRWLTEAQSESEFVGLLAHAMAHVANRDYTRNATRAEILRVAVQPMTSDGWAGYSIQQGMGMSFPLAMLQFQRTFERAADALAVKIAAAAGYDPAELARYVERTGKNDGSPNWDTFQKERLTELRRAVAAATVASTSDGSQFNQVREAIR